MKKGWESKEFEDCLEKIVYTNKIQKKDFLGSGLFPIISQEQNFINGYWDNAQDIFQVKKPVIVFGDHTTVLKYVDFDFVLGADGVKILQPNTNIDPRYFYYYLKNINLGNLGYARYYRLLKEIKIEYPKSLQTQQIIASILDEAFAAIDQAKENVQRNLQNAKELFQSELNDAFVVADDGCFERTLGDYFSIKHGFAFKSEFFSNAGKHILLTPGNFFEEGGYRDRGDKQKYYIGEIPQDYILSKNDLLIAMTEQAEGLLGSPAIVPQSDVYLHNQRLGLIIFKNKNEIDTKFLYHLFNTKRIRTLINQSASGVKVRHTSPSKVLEIKATLPNIQIQRKIAQKLDNLSTETKKLEEIYQQKLNALEELKKSILEKAFRGELVGREKMVGDEVL